MLAYTKGIFRRYELTVDFIELDHKVLIQLLPV